MLNEAAIQAKVDPLENLKENVICGHLIPGGTGLRDYDNLVVGSKAELNRSAGAVTEAAYTIRKKPFPRERLLFILTGFSIIFNRHCPDG